MKYTMYILVAAMLAPATSTRGQSVTSPSVREAATPSTNVRSSGTSVALPVLGTSRPGATVMDEAVMVIAAGGMGPETLAQLYEDMNIMCRVFDRLLEDAGFGTADWRSLFASSERHPTGGVYLPGFGPLFLIEVDFPLLPDSEGREEPAEEAGDALWLEVKQQMQGQPASDASGKAVPQYDELKVESLRRTLLDAMKHASNIRGLDPNDSIVVVAVNGPRAFGRRADLLHYLETQRATGAVQSEPRSLQVLSLQATKASVDAYATARITREQFGKQTGVTTYELPSLEASASPDGLIIMPRRTPGSR